MKLAVNDIAARLSTLDPGRGDAYRANASAYNARLDELHAWIERQVSAVPEDRRLLITSHDSLGYFANLYGFEVIGVVLSISTEVEPSPEDLADLVEEAKEYGVPAVFGETTVSERLANRRGNGIRREARQALLGLPQRWRQWRGDLRRYDADERRAHSGGSQVTAPPACAGNDMAL